MQLSVSGHHVDLTPALRNYVGTKLAKLERHFDNMTGNYTEIGCGISVSNGEVTVTQDFR